MARDTHPQLRFWVETPISLIAVADNLALFSIVDPCVIYEIGILIVTLGTGSLVVDFDRRITPGTDTGRIDKGLGTISKAAASLAAGKLLSKKIDVRLEKGDQISVQVTTALTTTGTGIAYMLGYASGAGAFEADEVLSD